jgi:NADPH:quinone reductase-like Zn-dependent oxidoreductase
MTQMRAMVYRSYGGPERLESAELPRPVAGANQVLVRVHASSVNPIDWKRGSGALRLIMPASFPLVPGFDIAGEVAAIGAGVTTFSVGMRVHARIGEMSGGASAEYAVAGVDVVAPMPAGLDFADAAGIPLAGMTALQGLRDQASMPLEGSKDRVLIVGASGGVGHFAVQIARASGATVVGVCSGRNAALVTSLGAHEVLDYTKPDPYRGQAPFDVVLDCVAGDPGSWLPLLGPSGRYASCVPGPRVFARSALNLFSSKQVKPVLLKSRATDLRILDALFEAGKLRVVIDSRHPLDKLAAAWERSISGRAAGKIIVDVASP